MNCSQTTQQGMNVVKFGKLNPGDSFYWCGLSVTVIKGPLRLSIKRKARTNLQDWENGFFNVTPDNPNKLGRYVFEELGDRELKVGDLYFVRRNDGSGYCQHLGIDNWCTKDVEMAEEQARRISGVVEQFKIINENLSQADQYKFVNKVSDNVEQGKNFLISRGMSKEDSEKTVELQKSIQKS